MPVYERKSHIDVSVKELFDWHNQPGTFERLTPPWERVRVIERKGGVADRGRLVLEMKQGPFRRRWVAVHGNYVEGRQFADEQVQGPFKKWVHTHKFLPETETTSLLEDHIEYQPPLGLPGQWLAGPYLSRRIDKLFSFRHNRTQNDLKRYHPFVGRGPLKIAMAGASGMIGATLKSFLACGGHQITTLVRCAPKPDTSEVFWDPSRHGLDKTSIEGMDAVIHLGGESIASGRWTASRKDRILRSRVDSTRFLSEALASLKRPPKVLLVSSAIGFYGNRGDEVLTEGSPAGKGFLSEVCQAWEAAAEPARKAGIRVVHIRTGIVLSRTGGALAQMLPPFLMGVGGRLGQGNQWMSWISLDDLIGIFHYLLYAENLSGPVNAAAPGAVTNRDFTKTLGKVLKRPAFLPLPALVIRMIFGEMGEALLLEGQRVTPAKLTAAGFNFLHPDLESALRWELGH